MTFIVITIILIILIIYIYVIKFKHPDHKIVTYNDICDDVKSGDLILFSSLDNYNQIAMASYYTHIGVIYRKDPSETPLLIEAFNPATMPFYPKEYSSGIIACDLEHRMSSYRGFCFYKQLSKPITEHANEDFAEFIEYSKKNIKYSPSVIQDEIGKLLFNTPFDTNTNCGQLTTLILIKLGLINMDYFTNRMRHHLRTTSLITKLKNNSYKPPVYVYSEYFKVASK